MKLSPEQQQTAVAVALQNALDYSTDLYNAQIMEIAEKHFGDSNDKQIVSAFLVAFCTVKGERS